MRSPDHTLGFFLYVRSPLIANLIDNHTYFAKPLYKNLKFVIL